MMNTMTLIAIRTNVAGAMVAAVWAMVSIVGLLHYVFHRNGPLPERCAPFRTLGFQGPPAFSDCGYLDCTAGRGQGTGGLSQCAQVLSGLEPQQKSL